MMFTSASPWQDESTGKVLWINKDELNLLSPSVQLWAASPIWVDAIGVDEFPACALKYSVFGNLPSGYRLTDFSADHRDAVSVTLQGLEPLDGLIEWRTLKENWPAIVNNAQLVIPNDPSPLLAMALWLGCSIESNYCPIYIPSGCKVPNSLSDVNVLHYQKLAKLRNNEAYRYRLDQCQRKNKARKKMKKLIRSPRLFFEDAKFFK